MMTSDEYVRKMFNLLPALAKDALDPQRIQTALAADIDKYYGESNPNPVYPRTDGGNTLQYVKGNLYKAATVYRAKGNVSGYKESGNNTFKGAGGSTTFTAFWAIDLDVIPYARIHDLGGEAGPKSRRVKIPKRPYITPAMKDFDEITFPKIIELMLRKLAKKMAE